MKEEYLISFTDEELQIILMTYEMDLEWCKVHCTDCMNYINHLEREISKVNNEIAVRIDNETLD